MLPARFRGHYCLRTRFGRDVEKRLELRQRWTHLPKPAAPFDKPANRNAVDDLPLMYELIALALQTDSTRIATLEIGGDFLPQYLGIKKDYHGLSHHGNDQESIAALITLERYQIAQYAKFVGRLAQMKDGEGTLLDSTTVLFGSGMGDANAHRNQHSHHHQHADARVRPLRHDGRAHRGVATATRAASSTCRRRTGSGTEEKVSVFIQAQSYARSQPYVN